MTIFSTNDYSLKIVIDIDQEFSQLAQEGTMETKLKPADITEHIPNSSLFQKTRTSITVKNEKSIKKSTTMITKLLTKFPIKGKCPN